MIFSKTESMVATKGVSDGSKFLLLSAFRKVLISELIMIQPTIRVMMAKRTLGMYNMASSMALWV
jgi:hypothetical protein